MPYSIQGKKHAMVYCVNSSVQSGAIIDAIINNGGDYKQINYDEYDLIPDGYVVVQTVRNHFDVLVDSWMFSGGGVSFTTYVERVLDGMHRYLGAESFYDSFGSWDYILRYETLQFETDILFLHIGLPQTTLRELPTKVKGESLFCDRLRNKVSDRYGAELERLGYGVG